MDKFRAYRIDEQDGKVVAGFQELTLDDLTEGDAVIKVSHSTINYKDALAATGAGKILRRYPLNGGIDLAGTIVSSENAELPPGTAVLVNGCGLSETVDGGYSEYARVGSDCIVPVPEGMSTAQAMQIGTAGYTAALAIHRMEQNGQLPENGPVVVTGATGGVGSIAIDMLDGRGYEVVAVTGKATEQDYLKSIGARRILLRDQLDLGKRPMEKAEWAGAIDNLGGDYLTWLTRTTDYGGNIASIGLASSAALTTTVLPFILRAVCLLGINSVDTPRALRLAVWSRIGGDLMPRHLDTIGSRTIGFDELPGAFQAYLDGTVTGRTVVAIT
ncbi:MAG: oxidoreductase [Gammaproteobacteria bacterium]|nr:oxidoreductase [Gammaproteobacteria bacterium]MDH3372120.1 oxidoreductase [Gammaproteobacteria bacterium]MDH3409082.1 oxidoreductase [Gammaproteobacteria bacterium]